MKTLNELLDLATQGKLDELDRLAAEVQGFEFAPIRYTGIGEDTTWQDNNESLVSKYYPTLDNVGDYWIDHENEKVYEDDYQPTRDKAQAWDLMVKAGLEAKFSDTGSGYARVTYSLETITNDTHSAVTFGSSICHGFELFDVIYKDPLIAVTIAFILAMQGEA